MNKKMNKYEASFLYSGPSSCTGTHNRTDRRFKIIKKSINNNNDDDDVRTTINNFFFLIKNTEKY